MHVESKLRKPFPPSTLETLFNRQIMQLNQELELKGRIPRLNLITDEVSLAVKNQYEEI